MKTSRLGSVLAFSFVIVSLMLAANASSAQTKSTIPHPTKRTDPAIRWEFNTHG